MDYRPIEVKLHCAKDLKDVNVFSKMDVYVIGSVSEDPRSMQRTMIDKDGGTNPKWNHLMKFSFDESAARLNRLGLVFQIMSNRTLGDKEVGRVYVPLKDLFDVVGVGDDTSNEVVDTEKHVVYQVQTPIGKFKGQLEFSFKLGQKYIQSIEQRLDESLMGCTVVVPISGLGPNPTQPKNGTSTYSGPSVSGAPYSHSAPLLGYPPQNYGYGYGYGYGCGYRYSPQHIPPMYPNPHMGYAYGNGYPGGYGYTPQAQPGQVQQPMMKQKSRLDLGAARVGVGVGVGLLGGLLVGEMVEDMAEVVAYDDMFGF